MKSKVLVCCNSIVRENYISGEALARLEQLADWDWLPSEGTSSRTDLWGGDSDAILESIRRKLFVLSDGLRVVCGHGPDTTIGEERRSNPFAAV